jgi:hypothetical protein
MSSLELLGLIQTNLFRFGGVLMMAIGTINCILNVMLFSRHALRRNPCSIYFIAVNVSNLLFLCSGILPLITGLGFGVDPSSTNTVLCRFHYYVSLITSCLGPIYLILASVDRAMITSRNVRTRQRSTRRLAIISVCSLALFWVLVHIHVLIYVNIIQIAPNVYLCTFQPGIYTSIISIYILLVYGLVPPLFLTIFGLRTVKNVRQLRPTVVPTHQLNNGVTGVSRAHTLQSKDHQLIRMLLTDIIVYIVLRTPFAIYYIYQEITQYDSKSAERVLVEQFINYMVYYLFNIVSSIDCYTNLLVSKTFRTELKGIFVRGRGH